MTRVGGR